MTGRTHLVLGLCAGLMVSPTPLGAMAGAVGGLIADIDHPQSIISGYLPGVGAVLNFVRVSHRTLTHSLLFVALMFGLVWAICNQLRLPMHVPFALGIGMLTHLIADMTTVAGVPLFLPLFGARFRLLPKLVLRLTQGVIEWIVFVGCIVLIAYITIKGVPF